MSPPSGLERRTVESLQATGTESIAIGTLLTFGYSLLAGSEDLRRLLEGYGVDLVVDVRLRPWSRNPAFSAATESTVQAAGLNYRWLQALGNLAYRSGGLEIKDIGAIDIVVGELGAGRTVALMCSCASPDRCHRSVLADEARRRLVSLRVVNV